MVDSSDKLFQHRLEQAEIAVSRGEAQRGTRWYPGWHIAARSGWINDPNGLCFYGGRYHVFFQHHPYSPEWGPMHWGHVSSTDLVRWRREPIALAPSLEEDRDGVFSGSAMEAPDGTLAVYYTGHRWRNGRNEDDGNLQVQCRAVSRDGIHFVKKGIVVAALDGVRHSRDPKVWRAHDGVYWMVLGVCSRQNRGEVWLYRSHDAVAWDYHSVLYQDPDPDAFMLECPDAFPVGDGLWAIVYCPMGPKPVGWRNRNGHNAGYVLGTWREGEVFQQVTDYAPVDWGHEFYAPQSFLAPDGRRLLFGWMGSFGAPLPCAQEGWSGQLTAPREVRLRYDGTRPRLELVPAAEVTRLAEGAGAPEVWEGELSANTVRRIAADFPQGEILLEWDPAATQSERLSVRLRSPEDGSTVVVAWDDLAGRIVVDRGAAGQGPRGVRGAPVNRDGLGGTGLGAMHLRLLVDRGSVEVFSNAADPVSSYWFAGLGDRTVELLSENGSTGVRVTLQPFRDAWEQ